MTPAHGWRVSSSCSSRSIYRSACTPASTRLQELQPGARGLEVEEQDWAHEHFNRIEPLAWRVQFRPHRCACSNACLIADSMVATRSPCAYRMFERAGIGVNMYLVARSMVCCTHKPTNQGDFCLGILFPEQRVLLLPLGRTRRRPDC